MRRRLPWLFLLVPLVLPMAALALATLTASPSSVTFATRCVRTGANPRTITIRNASSPGATEVHVSLSPSGAAAAFPLSGTTSAASLGPDRELKFSVGFQPQRAGATSAAAIVEYRTVDEPTKKPSPSPTPTTRTTTVALSGGGIDRFVDVSPRALNFGSSRVGRSVGAQRVTIFDDGASPLTVTGVSLGGRHAGDFSLSSRGSFTVVDGRPVTMSIGFTPRGVGARSADLYIRTDACSDATVKVSLAGIGVEPDIAARPDRVDLGEVIVSENATTDVKVLDQGQATLRVGGLKLFGPARASFSLTGLPTFPQVLTAGRSFSFTLRFVADAIGPVKASIRIKSNDPDHPTFDIPIQAAGVEPTPSPTPTLSIAPSIAPPPATPGAGFHLSLSPYLPEIVVSAAILAFFVGLFAIRRVRGVPE